MPNVENLESLYSPTPHDIDLARENAPILAAIIGRHQNEDEHVQFLNKEGAQMVIPAAAVKLLKNILVQMAQGNAVTVLPVQAELTSQETADLLNVSRPHLVKLLENRDIPFTKKGTHRRVQFQDVIAYKKRIDAERIFVKCLYSISRKPTVGIST